MWLTKSTSKQLRKKTISHLLTTNLRSTVTLTTIQQIAKVQRAEPSLRLLPWLSLFCFYLLNAPPATQITIAINQIIEKRIAIHLLRVTVPGHHRPHQQNHLHQILIHRQVVIQAIAVPASVTVTAPEANRAVKPKMNIMPKTIITPRTSTRITMMTSSITRTQRTIITTISTIEK